MEKLTERIDGPKISKDLDNITPIDIAGDVPYFNDFTEFRKWVADTLSNLGVVCIKETGQDILLSRAGAKRGLKGFRKDGHIKIYNDFKRLAENAKYAGVRYKNNKFPQDVFKQKFKHRETTYDLYLFADVLKNGELNYAGHKAEISDSIPTAANSAVAIGDI
ncbi:MAG: hypothetical protein LBT79_00220 [Elusimicrobiota bacterium]|jgi:hypothetical protein|nr:hypothetical protein [Elusimicrobiota bacterium]